VNVLLGVYLVGWKKMDFEVLHEVSEVRLKLRSAIGRLLQLACDDESSFQKLA
jgi:hypothetical protein